MIGAMWQLSNASVIRLFIMSWDMIEEVTSKCCSLNNVRSLIWVHQVPYMFLASSFSCLCSVLWSQGPVSISEKTSFRKISKSLEATRFVFRIVRSLWNFIGTSAAVLPMCLSNFKAIRQFKVPISWLRDFTRSYEKTSFRILRRGPGVQSRTCSWSSTDRRCSNYIWVMNNSIAWWVATYIRDLTVSLKYTKCKIS